VSWLDEAPQHVEATLVARLIWHLSYPLPLQPFGIDCCHAADSCSAKAFSLLSFPQVVDYFSQMGVRHFYDP
jgi:hypothetical protein